MCWYDSKYATFLGIWHVDGHQAEKPQLKMKFKIETTPWFLFNLIRNNDVIQLQSFKTSMFASINQLVSMHTNIQENRNSSRINYSVKTITMQKTKNYILEKIWSDKITWEEGL